MHKLTFTSLWEQKCFFFFLFPFCLCVRRHKQWRTGRRPFANGARDFTPTYTLTDIIVGHITHHFLCSNTDLGQTHTHTSSRTWPGTKPHTVNPFKFSTENFHTKWLALAKVCVLTSCSNVGWHTSAGPDAGGGHTLVSAYGEVCKGGDVERTGPHQHSQLLVAPSWQLYHRKRLFCEDWDII